MSVIWYRIIINRHEALLNFVQSECMYFLRYIGHYIGNVYKRDSGPIWLSDVNCTGYERHFNQCTHSRWGLHSCTHNQDVSISCIYTSPLTYAGLETLANTGTFKFCAYLTPDTYFRNNLHCVLVRLVTIFTISRYLTLPAYDYYPEIIYSRDADLCYVIFSFFYFSSITSNFGSLRHKLCHVVYTKNVIFVV